MKKDTALSATSNIIESNVRVQRKLRFFYFKSILCEFLHDENHILKERGEADVMKWRKIQSERKWLIIYLLLSAIYMIWRIFFTLPFSYGIIAMIVGVVLLVAECLGIFDFLVHFVGMTRLVVPAKPVLEEGVTYPEVDVFIATYNEPWEIIYKTVIGCKNMHYSDLSKVHIYVLDDGRREQIKALCEQVGVGYITRETNEHAKAGNINNALQHTTSPYIVTFDADMIPMNQFLMETIPYFIENRLKREQELAVGVKEDRLTKKLGFIQIPQAFYNADIFQYQLFSEDVIPNEQDYFHREVQLAKNSTNSVIYSGSNTVITRQALEEIDGFVTGIITEDIATGIRIQAKDYQCYAINQVLASGLAPYDLEAIIKQRNRWARGCIQTFRRVNPMLLQGLTAAQRLNYFDALLYWYGSFKRFIYLLAPILFTVFGVMVVDARLIEVLIFWLPTYTFNTIMFKKFSGNGRTMKWTNIYDTILMPTLLPAVSLESLGIKMKKFEVTAKKRNVNQESKYRLKLAIPHLLLFFFTVLGVLHSIIEIIHGNGEGYIINLFWLLVNGYALMMALFFVLERPVYRVHERFKIETPISFELNEVKYQAKTSDISETGLAFMSEYPYYFKPDEIYALEVRREVYVSKVEAKFLRVDTLGNGKFKYAFNYTNVSQDDYEQLVLILFDRIPDFPTQIISQSVFRDLARNMFRRCRLKQNYLRQYPRVKVNQSVSIQTNLGSQSCYLQDFNYDYLVMEKSQQIDRLQLLIGDKDFPIEYKYVRSLKKGSLYQVVHPLKSQEIEAIKQALEVWMK